MLAGTSLVMKENWYLEFGLSMFWQRLGTGKGRVMTYYFDDMDGRRTFSRFKRIKMNLCYDFVGILYFHRHVKCNNAIRGALSVKRVLSGLLGTYVMLYVVPGSFTFTRLNVVRVDERCRIL